jgi:hypothetical protein
MRSDLFSTRLVKSQIVASEARLKYVVFDQVIWPRTGWRYAPFFVQLD